MNDGRFRGFLSLPPGWYIWETKRIPGSSFTGELEKQ